jgi:outer membrane biosynthesis protein TonB
MAAPHEPAAAALGLAATALRETLAADELGRTGEARAAFRRAWDALRVATALLQEGRGSAEAHATEHVPSGHVPLTRTGSSSDPLPPRRLQADIPQMLVTPARLGLPDGYAWTELLVEDVRQVVELSSAPAQPGQAVARDAAGTILLTIAQHLAARGAQGAPEAAAQLGQLLARYALARATALHATLLGAPGTQLQRQNKERAAEYYRAYLYLSMHGRSSDPRASVLGRVLARYQWLAVAGISPAPTPAASVQPGAKELAFKELVFKDSMSSGQVALLLNYFPDAGQREDVRSEWRRLAVALLKVHPELVALLAREVAAAQAIAIEHRLPVFAWLVELLRGHAPALAGQLEAAIPAPAARPAPPPRGDAPRRPAEPQAPRSSAAPEPQTPLVERPPAAPEAPGVPEPRPVPARPSPARQTVTPSPEYSGPPPVEEPRLARPAQPAQPARAAPPAPSSSTEEPDSAPQVPPAQLEPQDEVNRIWFHYRQGQPLRDVFFRRKRRR